jgi:hypothetical protein
MTSQKAAASRATGDTFSRKSGRFQSTLPVGNELRSDQDRKLKKSAKAARKKKMQ